MEKYETTDLYVASYIQSQGGRLVGTRFLSGGQMLFTYEAEDPGRLVRDYLSNAMVPITTFLATLRTLRSMAKRGGQER